MQKIKSKRVLRSRLKNERAPTTVPVSKPYVRAKMLQWRRSRSHRTMIGPVLLTSEAERRKLMKVQ